MYGFVQVCEPLASVVIMIREAPSGPMLRCEKASQTRPEPSTAAAGKSVSRKVAPFTSSSNAVKAGNVYAVPLLNVLPPFVE